MEQQLHAQEDAYPQGQGGGEKLQDQRTGEEEDWFQDGAYISRNEYPMLNALVRGHFAAPAKAGEAKNALGYDAPQALMAMKEAIQWNYRSIEEMQLADKDIFIVIGPSRAGKGTLLQALLGQPMKLFKKTAASLRTSEVAK